MQTGGHFEISVHFNANPRAVNSLSLLLWQRNPAEAVQLSQMVWFWRATLLSHPAAANIQKAQEAPQSFIRNATILVIPSAPWLSGVTRPHKHNDSRGCARRHS